MKRWLRVLACAPLLGLIAAGGNVAEISKGPRGFQFRNGWMLSWGASKNDVLAHLPPQPSAHNPTPGAVALCTNQPELGQADRSVVDGDGCIVFPRALPKPYTNGPAWLYFSHDRFYRVLAGISTVDFDKVETSLVAALGKPKTRKIGIVQNGFGASFDNVTDVWGTGSVWVTLIKRSGEVDEGRFMLEYKPLAKEVPSRPLAKVPF